MNKLLKHILMLLSHKVVQELVYKKYDKYRMKQDKLYVSDFDKFLKETKLLEKMLLKLI